MAQTSWTDGVGDWFSPFNWSAGVPNAASSTSFDAQIFNGGIAQIFSSGASVRRITLGTLNGQVGGMLLDAGTLNVTENLRLGESGGMGNVTIRNNADVSAGVTILGVFSGSGLMTVSGAGSTLASQTLILGELASGTMVVRDGADVTGFHISLANSSNSAFGRMTVTGAGSTLVADNTLWVGRTGVGELTVDTGGAVTTPTLDVGSNTGGSGTVMITGAGSTLTSTNTLLVGNNGFGSMTIADGGRVNSIALALGFASGGSGTVTVTGAGSRLVDTFNSIHVGESGYGTLTIADGGTVTVNNGIGSVVVGAVAGGFASTLRIGTGAAPGTLEAGSISLFRANSKLELNHTGVATLGMPISGPGSVNQFGSGTTRFLANNTFSGPLTVSGGLVEVAAGGRINNATDSNVAVAQGQVATLRINGAGSKWINTASTFIGSDGTGTVVVENGGELRSDVQLLVNRFPTGNGTLTVTGAGSKAITNGEFRIADEGIGLVRVEAGGAITSGFVELARQATSNASAIVSGTGSTWSIAGDLIAGDRGIANLQIASGGKLTSTGGSSLGLASNAVATVALSGAGSVWEMNALQVGGAGMADVLVSGGAKLITRLGGGNSVSIGEQAGGIGSVTIAGVGTNWTNSGSVVVGNLGRGTVGIEAGAEMSAVGVDVGLGQQGSGKLSVRGLGSTLTTSGLVAAGAAGSGEIEIDHGGRIISNLPANNGIGAGLDQGSVGVITIDGNGSRWDTTGFAAIGYFGRGDLFIRGGGVLASARGFVGAESISVGNVLVEGEGSTWTNSGELAVGYSASGILTVANGGNVSAGNGTGVLTIGARNNSNGTVNVGAGGAPGTLAVGSIVFGAGSGTRALNFNHTGDFAFGAIPISGPGSVRKVGVGATTLPENATILSADSTYSGGTNIDGGTLRVTNPNGMGLGTGPVNVNPSTTIVSRVLNFADNAVAGSNAVNVFPIPGGAAFGGKVTFTDNASAGLGQFTAQGGTSPVVFDAAAIEFLDNSTASTATFVNLGGTASAGCGGETRFGGNSSAGQAVFTNHGGAVTGATFGYTAFDTPGSSAGTARFTNLGTATRDDRGFNNAGHLYVFQGSAANAIIINSAATSATGSSGRTGFGSSLVGATAASAGSATITNRGGDLSNAGGGATTFYGIGTAGNAHITSEGGIAAGAFGGTITFSENSTAGAATINTRGGAAVNAGAAVTSFEDTASGGSAIFNTDGASFAGTIGGLVQFAEDSRAGTAIFNNLPSMSDQPFPGTLQFVGNTSAQSATINNRGIANRYGGFTFFRAFSTAANSTIINESGGSGSALPGRTLFGNSATAGNATITAAGGTALDMPGGLTEFSNSSKAGAATLFALGGTNGGLGGRILLEDQASGESAAAIVQGNGTFTIENLTTAGTTLGSIAGSGVVSLGSKELVVGGNNISTVFSGSINGTSTSGLTKVGTGTLTLNGTNTAFAGTTFVGAGRLQVDSGLPGDAVAGGGSLAGIGPLNGSTRVGAFSGPTQAFLDPGATIGTITINGALSFTGFGTLRLELNSATQQFDRVVATGSVSLAAIGNGSLIALELGAGQFPMGLPFTILDKQSAGAISGSFAGLPEGAEFDVGANRFRISYVGGNGNDITLTNTIPEPSVLLLVVTGSAALVWRRRGALPGDSIKY